MSLKNKLFVLAISVFALATALMSSHRVAQLIRGIASAVWGS